MALEAAKRRKEVVKLDGSTKLVSQYVSDKGVSISAIADKTNIPYNALYPSLCRNPTRKLRGDELLAICQFLEVDPMRFYVPPDGNSNPKTA